MKVEIVNIETIKPLFPTPVDLKTYTLSVLDQVAPSIYVSLVFVYPAAANANNAGGYVQFSRTLKNSLSDALTLFPPLAGKIKDNVSVDCNDDGVQCYESRVYSTLDQLLSHPDIECLKHLIVVGDEVNVDTGVQLLVQINLFDCGGIAVGASFSHKLCDAATFTTFLKSWSAKAISSSSQVIVPPHLTVSTNFPPRKDVTIIRPFISPPTHDLISTRFVFDGQKIAALKAKSASPSTPQPTRVEAVTALIAKCAMVASKANKESYSMPYVLGHAVNLRSKLVPSLPETAFGNVAGGYAVYSEQSDASLGILVDKLRKGRMDYYDSLALNGEKAIDEFVQRIESAGVTFHNPHAVEMNIFTSWCKFGIYEVDFGLGKPIWVGYPLDEPYKNIISLLDTKDGNGIEAYVTLTKQDMILVQSDPLLLQYASLNPAV